MAALTIDSFKVQIKCLIVIGCFPLFGGFPTLRNQVPNGYRVACPLSVPGCVDGDVSKGDPESVCNGIGHAQCAGGGDLNVFGQALASHDHTWTQQLCEVDSDGDGLTNGEELGDPCCLWSAYDVPSEYTTTFSATHPGFRDADSVKSSYVRPSCSSTNPVQKSPVLGKFNSDEEQRNVTMLIKDYVIPAKKTTYVDIALNFPDDSKDIFHVVHVEAIVATPAHLHHYVIQGCSEKFSEEQNGKEIAGDAKTKCQHSFGGWAPGRDIVAMPSWAGLPIGKNASIVALVVNVHFDNQQEVAGVVSRDGFRIFYTPTLREDVIREFATTRVSLNPRMVIPPGKKRYFMTKQCDLTVKNLTTGKPAIANIFTVGYHAHLLGREMYSELVPAHNRQASIDVASAPIWHFDDQSLNNVMLSNITVQTGDTMQTSCVFDSTSRTTDTTMNRETTDEMCWASFKTWPGDVQAYCKGPVWLGELAEGEPGLGLAARHPVSDASFVFDGSSALTGGALTGGQLLGAKPEGCEDQPFCPKLVQRMSTVTGDICSMPFGSKESPALNRLTELYPHATIMDLCCATACKDLCPSHGSCNGTAEVSTSMDTDSQASTSIKIDSKASISDTKMSTDVPSASMGFYPQAIGILHVVGISLISVACAES